MRGRKCGVDLGQRAGDGDRGEPVAGDFAGRQAAGDGGVDMQRAAADRECHRHQAVAGIWVGKRDARQVDRRPRRRGECYRHRVDGRIVDRDDVDCRSRGIGVERTVVDRDGYEAIDRRRRGAGRGEGYRLEGRGVVGLGRRAGQHDRAGSRVEGRGDNAGGKRGNGQGVAGLHVGQCNGRRGHQRIVDIRDYGRGGDRSGGALLRVGRGVAGTGARAVEVDDRGIVDRRDRERQCRGVRGTCPIDDGIRSNWHGAVVVRDRREEVTAVAIDLQRADPGQRRGAAGGECAGKSGNGELGNRQHRAIDVTVVGEEARDRRNAERRIFECRRRIGDRDRRVIHRRDRPECQRRRRGAAAAVIDRVADDWNRAVVVQRRREGVAAIGIDLQRADSGDRHRRAWRVRRRVAGDREAADRQHRAVDVAVVGENIAGDRRILDHGVRIVDRDRRIIDRRHRAGDGRSGETAMAVGNRIGEADLAIVVGGRREADGAVGIERRSTVGDGDRAARCNSGAVDFGDGECIAIGITVVRGDRNDDAGVLRRRERVGAGNRRPVDGDQRGVEREQRAAAAGIAEVVGGDGERGDSGSVGGGREDQAVARGERGVDCRERRDYGDGVATVACDLRGGEAARDVGQEGKRALLDAERDGDVSRAGVDIANRKAGERKRCADDRREIRRQRVDRGIVDRGDGDGDGRGRETAAAVGDRIGERVCAVEIGSRRIDRISADRVYGDAAVRALRDGSDGDGVAIRIGVVAAHGDRDGGILRRRHRVGDGQGRVVEIDGKFIGIGEVGRAEMDRIEEVSD